MSAQDIVNIYIVKRRMSSGREYWAFALTKPNKDLSRAILYFTDMIDVEGNPTTSTHRKMTKNLKLLDDRDLLEIEFLVTSTIAQVQDRDGFAAIIHMIPPYHNQLYILNVLYYLEMKQLVPVGTRDEWKRKFTIRQSQVTRPAQGRAAKPAPRPACRQVLSDCTSTGRSFKNRPCSDLPGTQVNADSGTDCSSDDGSSTARSSPPGQIRDPLAWAMASHR
jgi:hypothetical protein